MSKTIMVRNYKNEKIDVPGHDDPIEPGHVVEVEASDVQEQLRNDEIQYVSG